MTFVVLQFSRLQTRLIDGITILIFAVLLALIAVYPLRANHDAALFLEYGNRSSMASSLTSISPRSTFRW